VCGGLGAQLMRLDELGVEALGFDDCICQCLDMVNPKGDTVVALVTLNNTNLNPLMLSRQASGHQALWQGKGLLKYVYQR
jgi:hypothetical protein